MKRQRSNYRQAKKVEARLKAVLEKKDGKQVRYPKGFNDKSIAMELEVSHHTVARMRRELIGKLVVPKKVGLKKSDTADEKIEVLKKYVEDVALLSGLSRELAVTLPDFVEKTIKWNKALSEGQSGLWDAIGRLREQQGGHNNRIADAHRHSIQVSRELIALRHQFNCLVLDLGDRNRMLIGDKSAGEIDRKSVV